MTGSVIDIARLDATAFREADEAIPTSTAAIIRERLG
jgi:hypothetical protein